MRATLSPLLIPPIELVKLTDTTKQLMGADIEPHRQSRDFVPQFGAINHINNVYICSVVINWFDESRRTQMKLSAVGLRARTHDLAELSAKDRR